MRLAYGLRRRAGQEKEKLAGRYLRSRGAKILQFNYQCRSGEIDLIAQLQEWLLFVEVKFRSNLDFGLPQASVTGVKQRRIIQCARYFLAHHPTLAGRPCRFDVIAIMPGGGPDKYRVEWIRNAFQLSC